MYKKCYIKLVTKELKIIKNCWQNIWTTDPLKRGENMSFDC